jgi:hypothetical protein
MNLGSRHYFRASFSLFRGGFLALIGIWERG